MLSLFFSGKKIAITILEIWVHFEMPVCESFLLNTDELQLNKSLHQLYLSLHIKSFSYQCDSLPNMALIPSLIGYYYHDNLNWETWHVRFIKTKEGDVTGPAPPAEQ